MTNIVASIYIYIYGARWKKFAGLDEKFAYLFGQNYL